MAKYFIEDTTLTAIADAIRAKDGSTEPILTEDMASRIEAILSCGDTSVEDGLITNSLTEYTNNRVTTITPYAFFQRSNLVSFTSSSVTRLDVCVFQNCSKLKNINVPNLVTAGQSSLRKSALEKIILPSLETFGAFACAECSSLQAVDFYCLKTFASNYNNFVNCTNLTTLIIRSDSIVEMPATSVLKSTPIESGTGYIYVPNTLVEEYKAATNWAIYADQIRVIEDWQERIDIITQPTDISALVDTVIYFSCEADGMGLEYRWQTSKDNGVTWGDNSGVTAKYKVTVKEKYNGYIVRCIITNINGVEVISDAVTLTVTE